MDIEPTGRVVFFARPVQARYLKLVSLGAPNNQPYAGAAEIGIMGKLVKWP